MKVRLAVVLLSSLLISAAPSTRPAGFKYVSVTTQTDEHGLPRKLHRKEIYFIGDSAFVVDTEGVPDMHMDLRKQTASDEQGAKWMLADLQHRAEQEREAARKRAEKTKDPAAAEHIKFEADPAFAFSDEGGKVIASNPLARYEMECVPIDSAYVKRLYLALRLHTLATASATSPPYAALALGDELERRGCIVQDGKAVAKAGDKQIETRIQSRLTPLSDEDQKRLATLLLPAGGL